MNSSINVFNEYAHYYDLFYRDKDYAAEARFVHHLLESKDGCSRDLLDIGCGTGRHAFELARLGYHVTGIDLSEGMILSALAHCNEIHGLAFSPEFLIGDARSFRAGRTFDSVISLFHVMSYQTSNADLRAALNTAAVHLRPGGKFVFDFWYGPAVLSDPPLVRIRRMEDSIVEVTRIAEPAHTPNSNLVVVNYHVFLRNKCTREMFEIRESHPMRYLFLLELEGFLDDVGFDLTASGAWNSPEPLSQSSWYGWGCAVKR